MGVITVGESQEMDDLALEVLACLTARQSLRLLFQFDLSLHHRHSLTKQLKRAHRLGLDFVLILGEDELQRGQAQYKMLLDSPRNRGLLKGVAERSGGREEERRVIMGRECI